MADCTEAIHVSAEGGAALGQRWEYHDGRKMVTLWVQTGKVVRIDEQ